MGCSWLSETLAGQSLILFQRFKSAGFFYIELSAFNSRPTLIENDALGLSGAFWGIQFRLKAHRFYYFSLRRKKR